MEYLKLWKLCKYRLETLAVQYCYNRYEMLRLLRRDIFDFAGIPHVKERLTEIQKIMGLRSIQALARANV